MTRYLMTLRTYDSVATIEPEAADDGAWVYVDEAEAEIRELNIELQEAVRLLRKWAPFSKRLPATLEYDALAEGTDAFLARYKEADNA